MYIKQDEKITHSLLRITSKGIHVIINCLSIKNNFWLTLTDSFQFKPLSGGFFYLHFINR
jgi:hypothetical protein